MESNQTTFCVHDLNFPTMIHCICMTKSIVLISLYAKKYQTKTELTARTGRIAHNDRLLRVRMCEPRYITTKAAIVLKFVSIRIDGSTIGKWDILKKDWFTELPNPRELLEYDKAVL
jgi:hypothetical protein